MYYAHVQYSNLQCTLVQVNVQRSWRLWVSTGSQCGSHRLAPSAGSVRSCSSRTAALWPTLAECCCSPGGTTCTLYTEESWVRVRSDWNPRAKTLLRMTEKRITRSEGESQEAKKDGGKEMRSDEGRAWVFCALCACLAHALDVIESVLHRRGLLLERRLEDEAEQAVRAARNREQVAQEPTRTIHY